jgi:aryl sulfotransferase
MGDILWLASYPKSGNTWMRILLSNYLGDSEQPADINALEGDGISSSRDLFDGSVGVRSASLPDGTVERLRPEVYRYAARSVSSTIRVKAHDAYHRVPGGEPLFPADVSRGAVYLVRDPRDVAVSQSHHAGRPVEAAVARLNDPAGALAAKHRVAQLPQRMGSWSDHVRSWADQTELPVHVVRYEDLLADTAAELAAVLTFAGHEPDPDRLRHAVEASSMPRLQAQEEAASFRERPRRNTGRFFRRGVAGGWRDDLAPELARAVEDAHRDVMVRFGYLEPV